MNGDRSPLSPEVEVLVTDWFRRVRESQRVHYECGTYFSQRRYFLGIPAIVLSTAVGTAVFASLESAAARAGPFAAHARGRRRPALKNQTNRGLSGPRRPDRIGVAAGCG